MSKDSHFADGREGSGSTNQPPLTLKAVVLLAEAIQKFNDQHPEGKIEFEIPSFDPHNTKALVDLLTPRAEEIKTLLKDKRLADYLTPEAQADFVGAVAKHAGALKQVGGTFLRRLAEDRASNAGDQGKGRSS